MALKKNILLLFAFLMLFMIPVEIVGLNKVDNKIIVTAYADEIKKDTGLSGVNESYKKLKDTVNDITKFVVALGLTTSVLLLIIHFIRLGMTPVRPFDRRKIINDIVIVGICTAGLGALGLIAMLIMTVYENGLAGGI